MGLITGFTVSIVNDNAAEVALLPDESESVTVTLQTPSGDRCGRIQAPEEIVQVTGDEPDFIAVTFAVPVNVPDTFMVGVLSCVMLSVLETPKSDVASRSGVAGAATVVLLITTLDSAVPASELTPPPD